MVSPRISNKAAMLTRLLSEQGLTADTCIYVGDKIEDGEAASHNHLPFFAAAWGYGEFSPDTTPPQWTFTVSPKALGAMLLG